MENWQILKYLEKNKTAMMIIAHFASSCCCSAHSFKTRAHTGDSSPPPILQTHPTYALKSRSWSLSRCAQYLPTRNRFSDPRVMSLRVVGVAGIILLATVVNCLANPLRRTPMHVVTCYQCSFISHFSLQHSTKAKSLLLPGRWMVGELWAAGGLLSIFVLGVT